MSAAQHGLISTGGQALWSATPRAALPKPRRYDRITLVAAAMTVFLVVLLTCVAASVFSSKSSTTQGGLVGAAASAPGTIYEGIGWTTGPKPRTPPPLFDGCKSGTLPGTSPSSVCYGPGTFATAGGADGKVCMWWVEIRSTLHDVRFGHTPPNVPATDRASATEWLMSSNCQPWQKVG